ncbi:hypothetical protein H0H92_000025 [Tricholoma furcatifolium]|nr:hypothetical protein H0H92_000025 [Tricholoma furcatifolium]
MSDSFLPRIQSVFYSVFDIQQGPKIVYQVPEGLIAVSESLTTPTSPTDYYREQPTRPTSSSSPVLFHFDDVSKYVIPPSQLCGRLVTCSTKNHRVIGFPVELRGNYERNYFRYNLCFVFDRSADLSCYEPIVRKKESGFLYNPEASVAIPTILEQLYEDLNSYSETSIAIDRFNSIELKIFPFYPNPPQVKDWMVPLALINITKRVEDNWDLTMVKVCKYIDGTNHVSRIAHLADCDIYLTRQAISHLLFYQVIMTIDIFQYSNMYTLSNSIQWLADEAHVRDECGPYVTKMGHPMPDWPKLLRLYSRMKPGKTILEWMDEHNVHNLGIDVRRFTSFGVIKGFLRRVHRYPILLHPDPSQMATLSHDHHLQTAYARQRGESLSGGTVIRFPYTPSPPHGESNSSTTHFRGRTSSTAPGPGQNGSPEVNHSNHSTPKETNAPTTAPISATHRARRASAAEKVLEQLRSRSDLQKPTTSLVGSPRAAWAYHHENVSTPTAQDLSQGSRRPESRRQSLITPANPPPPSPVVQKSGLATTNPTRMHSRQSWNQNAPQLGALGMRPIPAEFLTLLDGEHHTDELAVRFEAGWPLIEQWLVLAGGGAGDGDFGRVCIIYR